MKNLPNSSKQGFVHLVLLFLVVAGAAAVIGSYIFLQSKSVPDSTNKTPSVTSASNIPQIAPLDLVIESPNENTLAEGKKINVKGKTSPNTTVVIYTDDNDTTIESDESGEFEGNIDLNNGINSLTVSAFREDGSQKSSTMDVVYDDQKT